MSHFQEVRRVSRHNKAYALVEDIENPYYLDFRPVEDEKLGNPIAYCHIGFCDITGKMGLNFRRKSDDKFLTQALTPSHHVFSSAVHYFELMLMLGKI